MNDVHIGKLVISYYTKETYALGIVTNYEEAVYTIDWFKSNYHYFERFKDIGYSEDAISNFHANYLAFKKDIGC